MSNPTESGPPSAECPVNHDERRLSRPGPRGPAVERTEKEWIIRSAAVAREVLRQGETARQAGFSAEAVFAQRLRLPLIYNYGESHRVQRSNLARFFAPKTVDSRYRGLMAEQVRQAVSQLTVGRTVEVDRLSMRYSVGVAREVVGLTSSSVDGLSKRLDRFFGSKPALDDTVGQAIYRYVSMVKLGLFHIWDVRPAAQERRREPREDVISYLVAEGCTNAEILMECVVYAAAGMVSTREFISLALWQLITRPQLRQRFMAGDQAERYSILYEILRLDPILIGLHRTMAQDLTISHDGQEYTFAKGDRVNIKVTDANTDDEVTGECPASLQPARPLPRGFKADVISFGEGPHRCAGAFLAIQESDMLLQEMLKHNLVVEREPNVSYDPVVDARVLRGMRVRVVS